MPSNMNMHPIVLVLALALAGCTVLPAATPAEEARLLAAAAAPDGDPMDIPDQESLLALTPQMKHFAEAAVAGFSTQGSAVRALLQAIIDPGQLALQFDETATFNAAEAYEQARANCLSFTAMFIAMARHVGLEAHFNEVDVPPVWGIHGRDTLVLYKHVNALVSVGRGRWQVIDVYPEEYDISYPQRKISDRQATAQYYNNLAMDWLRADRPVAARRHLAKAIELAPEISYLWGNLGTAFWRSRQTAAAELAFVKAMRIEPRDAVAVSNAARLFADTGRPELAARLERRAARFREQNPYYRYRQALDAAATDQYAAAKVHALAAIRLYDKEHRFHFLLGAVYSQLGNPALARESFARAMELADDEQALRYGRKMALLTSTVF